MAVWCKKGNTPSQIPKFQLCSWNLSSSPDSLFAFMKGGNTLQKEATLRQLDLKDLSPSRISITLAGITLQEPVTFLRYFFFTCKIRCMASCHLISVLDWQVFDTLIWLNQIFNQFWSISTNYFNFELLTENIHLF